MKWGILLFGGLVTIQPLIDKISVATATAIVSFFFISLNNLEKVLANPWKVEQQTYEYLNHSSSSGCLFFWFCFTNIYGKPVDEF